MTAITDTDYQKSMADAVRGELVSGGCSTITHLSKILGKSRPTAASRWHGITGYQASELEDVARFLGVTVYDLNDSARVRVERRGRDDIPTGARTAPPVDAWAQPSRAKARRAS